MAATVHEVLYSKQLLEGYYIQKKRLIEIEEDNQHVYDYDTTGSMNEFLEKCKCIQYMVSFATDL